MLESDSMNQTTQKYLEDAMDSGKDITNTQVRTEINKQIYEKHPDWNVQSIASSLSKSKGRIAKKRGIKKSDLGIGSKKPLFDDALILEVDKTGAVETTGLESTNPLVKKNKDGTTKIIKKETESPLSEEAFGSVGSLGYDIIALSDPDMEELTEQERKDFANVLKPIADKYFAGEKSTVLFAIGAMFGLVLKKKKKAKRIRHERELKSGKPLKKDKSLKEKILGEKQPEKLSGTTIEEKPQETIQSEGGKQN